MRYLVLTVLTLSVWACTSSTEEVQKKDIHSYFESIKKDPAALKKFFTQMPKGGDLHHHAAGTPYAEEFLANALADSSFLNPTTCMLYATQVDAENAEDTGAREINALLAVNPALREVIIDQWSVRNHTKRGVDGHDQFFSTFFKFFPAFIGHEAELLSAMCERAKKDHIYYLETMIDVPSVKAQVALLGDVNQWNADTLPVEQKLTNLFNEFETKGIDHLAQANADSLNAMYTNTVKHGVKLRFQTYGLRVYNNAPLTFGELVLGFKTALITDKLVAVNFVAPEDDAAALANYDLHMAMFAFLSKKYPEVNISLHAGELVSGKGSTSQEDLKFHINEALHTAKATRIGHGVDIAKEDSVAAIMAYMKANNCAVEINLESNEVILETTPATHPIQLYLKNQIPVCISTDDEGVLRTNLINQYVLLVKYVPEISYSEVKQIVANSIVYSFLSHQEKHDLKEQIAADFTAFELAVLN